MFFLFRCTILPFQRQSFVMKHGPSIIHKKKRIDKMKAFMSFLILLQSSIVTFLYLLFQILYSASFFIHSSETNIRRSTEYHQKNVFVDIDYLKYLQASSINPNVRAKRISFRKFGNWEKFIFNWWTKTRIYRSFLLDATFVWYLLHILSYKIKVKSFNIE